MITERQRSVLFCPKVDNMIPPITLHLFSRRFGQFTNYTYGQFTSELETERRSF
uniref:Uncharacterized protein n=1 Tax=Anguilla anguilla TaxID=7936 RepID=A0A0E9R7X6_ANGAN